MLELSFPSLEFQGSFLRFVFVTSTIVQFSKFSNCTLCVQLQELLRNSFIPQFRNRSAYLLYHKLFRLSSTFSKYFLFRFPYPFAVELFYYITFSRSCQVLFSIFFKIFFATLLATVQVLAFSSAFVLYFVLTRQL